MDVKKEAKTWLGFYKAVAGLGRVLRYILEKVKYFLTNYCERFMD